ncbi:MAG: excinuclease ABC subunit A [Candidatus Omnitrophica bacterium]|nr:excinuclease ABC subunit A [Candidatus Omnitrophota bacterium]
MNDETEPAVEADHQILIRGAREHNLKNLSLAIPRDQFVVVTGVSGSGKSTLAFDLLFAEGQRRFLDAMNTYARQFVEQLSRPDVDLVAGIPPTVSIEQRNSRGGGKSTVATVTEIYHFLRLLFARAGTPYCPDCQVPVGAQTRDQLGRHLQAELMKVGDLMLLAPVVINRKGFHTEIATWAAQHGYEEIRADGKIYSTRNPFRLDRFREHNVEIVVGVLEQRPKRGSRAGTFPQRLIDEALQLGHGTLFTLDNHRRLTVYSTERACPQCGRSFEPLDPKMLSYNSPRGWCPRCRGFGELFYLPDVKRGANAESIEESWFHWQEGQRDICPECHGTRLNPVARAVRLIVGGSAGGLTVVGLAGMSVAEAARTFRGLRFHGRQAAIAQDILPEIRERLRFLEAVGLGYMQLGRGITTLSSGESQRIRLAAQLGSNLRGVLYVLDEPTIGLHARDNERLLATLAALKSRGNSLLVVEHDEATMRHADFIIDLGPGAGLNGGQVVATGTLRQLMRCPASITGQCLRQKRAYPTRGERRPVDAGVAAATRGGQAGTPALVLHHARRHNLKDLTVAFPLNRLVLITGVSGSGKSTLIRECLLPALRLKLAPGSSPQPGLGEPAAVSGCESIRAVYEVDQTPIGRTPRSVPATYVGLFDAIRKLFAQVPEARLRGYLPGRFSFNSKLGRCPACEGAGVIKMEMNFLPPAYVRCETCNGTRFNRETLDIEFHGRNIAQVLDLSVAEAIEFFDAFSQIRRPLEALRDTGLDYIKLGQTSPTLSGGEAQRLKLVTHLLTGFRPSSATTGPSRPVHHVPAASLFLLEEPTIGLHTSDVRRLIDVLQRLIDAGHSVIVIEHNLDVIAEADWVVDLGPEGGDAGGQIVAAGTPEQLAKNKDSHTGRFLRNFLSAMK